MGWFGGTCSGQTVIFLARKASLCHVVVASACPQRVQGRREVGRVWGKLPLTRTGEKDGLIAQEGDPAVSKNCDFLLCFLSTLEAFLSNITIFLLHSFPEYLKASQSVFKIIIIPMILFLSSGDCSVASLGLKHKEPLGAQG